MEDHSGDFHPAAHGELHSGTGGHAVKEATACGEPVFEQTPGRSCGPRRGAHTGAGFLPETVAYGGPMQEQSIPEGLTPWKGCMLEQLVKDPTLEQGKSTGRKEQQKQHVMN
ncbi:secretory carrier-associated membrane protein 1-like [Grus japonensis]|uniref:Secretory carrier-associated membrane protein 1-like n=1 Tax=Grus japonensis TaxID=30415 RepID=A0ABC9VZB7_GRUJA